MAISNPPPPGIVVSALENDLFRHGLAGYGDAGDPFRINDNVITAGSLVFYTVVAQYIIVELHCLMRLASYRYYEHNRVGQNSDGVLRIQYWDEDTQAWIDWVPAITIAVGVSQWRAWAAAPAVITTRMIRAIADVLDTGGIARVEIVELQVRGT